MGGRPVRGAAGPGRSGEVGLNGARQAENGKHPPHVTSILLVGFAGHELDFLRHLFHCPECPRARNCEWAIEIQASVGATLTALRTACFHVVLCDDDRMPHAWKELLAGFEGFSQPPSLIVTSRLADERLWAEALNLGAYDLLARPFDAAEVLRSVRLARWHWQSAPAPRPS